MGGSASGTSVLGSASVSGSVSASESESTSTSESQRTVIYESVSGTLSASDSESSVSDSVLESMSDAESYLHSESTLPANADGSRVSRIGSLLSSLNIFGHRT